MGNKLQGPQTKEAFKEEVAKLSDGDSSVYWLLEQSASKVKADRECVLAAVKKNGLALDVADKQWKADKDIVIAAVENDVDAYSYVDKTGKIWEDKEVVLTLVKKQGFALEYAKSLITDKDVVLAAVSNKGSAIQHADAKLKGDKDVVLAAVENERTAWLYISKTADMWKDEEFVQKIVKMQGDTFSHVDKTADFWKDQSFVLSMVKLQGSALEFAAKELKEDREVVVAAVTERGDALEFVDKKASLWREKDVVLSLVQLTGRALEFASDDIKADKEVVLTAVRTTPTSLKFAQKDLQDDQELKKASGLFSCPVDKAPVQLQSPKNMQQIICVDRRRGNDQQTSEEKGQVSLSVKLGVAKFGVATASTDYAANFAVMLERNVYLCNFKIQRPNEWRLSSCDPKFKHVDDPCLGTTSTCQLCKGPNLGARPSSTSNLQDLVLVQMCGQRRSAPTLTSNQQSLTLTQKSGQRWSTPAPRSGAHMQQQHSCGRFSFRKQLEESNATKGFMIQVQEKHGLGDGQKIETKMAQEENVKIFRTIATSEDVKEQHLVVLEDKIKEWYKRGSRNMYMEEIFLK